jgi:hypothetical protein
MGNPFNRNSAPGRARDASQRSGSFKPGHQKLGGRKKGTPNRISRDTKQLLLEVVRYVGSIGDCNDGVVGYYKWLAKCHPKVFVSQLARLLPLETPKAVSRGWANETATAFELNETLRKQVELQLRGRPSDDPGVFEDLVRLAVEAPQSFAAMLGATLLIPPKKDGPGTPGAEPEQHDNDSFERGER